MTSVICTNPVHTLFKHGHSRPRLPDTHTDLHASQPLTLTPQLLWGPHTPPPALPHPQHRPGPERRSRGRPGPGACVQGTTFLGASVPLRSALRAGGGAGCPEQSPPPAGRLPTPLGRDFRERGAQVIMTVRGHARPCWPPSCPPTTLTHRGRQKFLCPPVLN